MWIKYYVIVACYLAALVYARRSQPTRTSTTPTSLITPATEEPPSIDTRRQETCMSRILSGVGIQSSNNSRFIVVTKKGHGRSFRRRHPELMDSTLAIQSDGSGRDLPMTVVNLEQAESVRKLLVYAYVAVSL